MKTAFGRGAIGLGADDGCGAAMAVGAVVGLAGADEGVAAARVNVGTGINVGAGAMVVPALGIGVDGTAVVAGWAAAQAALISATRIKLNRLIPLFTISSMARAVRLGQCRVAPAPLSYLRSAVVGPG